MQDILSALQSLAGGAFWGAMLAIAAAGTIAMGTLQVIKELTPIRRFYQRAWLERWVDNQASQLKCQCSSSTLNTVVAKNQVIELATGGSAEALYDLQVEDLVAQINLAVPVILDEADRYMNLLLVLSCGAAPTDLSNLRGGQPTSGPTNEYFEVRNRVGRRIQRNLDGVKLALGGKWRFWMQVTALTLTTITVEIAVSVAGFAHWHTMLLALPVGIIGGYFAPVSRDLLAALQRLRDP